MYMFDSLKEKEEVRKRRIKLIQLLNRKPLGHLPGNDEAVLSKAQIRACLNS